MCGHGLSLFQFVIMSAVSQVFLDWVRFENHGDRLQRTVNGYQLSHAVCVILGLGGWKWWWGNRVKGHKFSCAEKATWFLPGSLSPFAVNSDLCFDTRMKTSCAAGGAQRRHHRRRMVSDLTRTGAVMKAKALCLFCLRRMTLSSGGFNPCLAFYYVFLSSFLPLFKL